MELNKEGEKGLQSKKKEGKKGVWTFLDRIN